MKEDIDKFQMGKYVLRRKTRNNICEMTLSNEKDKCLFKIKTPAKIKMIGIAWNELLLKAVGLNSPIEKDIDDEKKWGAFFKRRRKWRKRSL